MKHRCPTRRVALSCILLSAMGLLISSPTLFAQVPNCGYATSQQAPINSGVCALCTVQNPGNSVDADTTNYATVVAAVNGVGYYGQLLKFNNTYLAGDSISIVMEVPSQLVSANLLGGIRLQTYAGTAATGPVITASDPLLRVQLLGGGTNKFRITFSAANNFDGVGVSITGAVALLSSLRIYTAQAFVPSPRIFLPLGIQATSETSPLYSGVCVLCSVSNPLGAVDRDTTTYSTITPAVGALGYISQLLRFPGSFHAGDSISLLLRLPVGLADVQALGGIRVETYSGNTPSGNPRFLNTLARIELLGGSGNFRVTFAPGENFDGVAVGINGTAAALSSLRVYDAAVTYSTQMIITACTGTSTSLNANMPVSAAINWYTTASGGSPVATGASFTTPPLSSATTYYVEAGRNGCINPIRTAVTIQPVAIPAAPVITPSSLNICPGDSVLAVAANNGTALITWYTVPTGGSALSSGDTLRLPGPAVTTTYYAQASNGNCTSTARTPITVTVGAAPLSVTVSPSSATITSGQTASFSASSADAGAVYNWYTQAAGGSPVATGSSFTTPALNASTTYYLQAQSAAGCFTTPRIAVPVTVNNSGNNMPCDAATTQSANTNGICIGCSVVNASSATDSDTTTYSQLHVVAGLAGGYTEQDLHFPFQGDAGDTIVLGIRFPASVADVNLLSSLRLASYNGGTYNNDRVAANGTLVNVSLLPGNTNAILKFVPQASFDRLQVRLNSGIAGLISEADLRYATRVKPAATIIPVSPTACAGNPVTLSATGNANTTFKWYDAATGGTLLFTGNAFTTPALSTNTSYYVSSVSGTGCESAGRRAVTVTVAAVPAAPVAASAQLTACNGSAVTANVQSPDPSLTYRWYTVGTGGTPVFTGSSFTSGSLTADTIFYAEAVNAGGCASNTRTPVRVSVSALPPAPAAVATSGAVCAGNSATLAVTNPLAGYTYQWFDAATNGTLLSTGNNFTTPALTATTTFYVNAVSPQGCAGSRTPVAVTVNPLPAAPVVDVTPAGSINSGQTATLNIHSPAAGATYHFYVQSNGGVPVASGNSYTTPALSTSTAYYVEAVSAGGCASMTRTVVNISVNQVVTLDCDAASAQSNTANGLCIGCTVSSPGNAVDNDNSTASQFNMTVAAPGANLQQTLIFPSASEPGDSVSILIGLPGSLNVSVLGGALQVETFNGGASNGDLRDAGSAGIRVYPQSGNRFVLRFAPAATFDRVRVTMNSGLVSLFTSLQIYFASKQVAPPTLVSNAVAVCSGGDATLSVVPQANVTVRWYTAPSGGTAVATGNTFTATGVTTNTVYYAEASRTSNSCVNTTRVPVQVMVNPAPAAPTVSNGNVTVCTGTTASLFVSNASPALTYRWYADASGGAALATGSSYTTPPVNANTIYYAEAANTTGCPSSTRTPVNIAVATAPAAPVITGNTGTCEGSAATLTITNPSPGATYNFYNTASGGSVLYMGTSFTTPSLSASRSFYVETLSAEACSAAGGTRTEIPVTVNAAPAAPVVNNSTVAVCSGSVANLTVANPPANTTYQWYDAAAGGNVVYTGASITTAPVTGNTTLYAQANSAAGCGSSSRTPVSVQPISAPAAPTVANNTGSVCEGGSAQLSVTNTGGGNAYDWFDAATGGNLVFTGEEYTTPALAATVTYYVSARNGNGCSSARTPLTVTVNAVPDAPVVAPANPSVAANGNVTLAISNPQPGFTYRFYNAGGTLLGSGTSYNTGSLSSTTTFFVEAVNASGCGSSTRTPVTVTVSATPPLPVVSGNNTAICANSSANLSISNAENDVTYNWYDKPSGGTLLFTAPAITTPLLSQTTKYYVEATRNGNTSARTEVTVAVNPRPATPVVNPAVVESCSATPVTLMVQSPEAGTTYSWYTTPVGGTAAGTGTSFTLASPQTGAYYFDAVNSFGCASLARAAVGITVMPVLSSPTASVDVKTATSITFKWTGVPGATGYEVSVNGAPFTAPSSGVNGLTHMVNNLKPGQSLSFNVRALGTLGCQASAASNTLTIDADNPLGDQVFIPNSFTPNGDGRNDRFKPMGNTIGNMDIYIYSQWGALLYRGIKDELGWDGTSGGKLQPVGVYIYIINLTMRDGKMETRKGSVNLIR